MAARNPDAAFNSDPNGFHPSKPRDEPLTTTGHKPGVQVGNDAVPEFSAKVLPAGTAPASKTFEPQNDQERPPGNADADAKPPAASDTIGGATSADVHTGLGKPIQGQSSAELHHDGQSHRKNPGSGGVEGVGGQAKGKTVDPHLPENQGQRALDNEDAQKHAPRGNVGGAAAEDKVPETAETVASEANR